MERLLRPERLDIDPKSVGAEAKWLHWKKTFTNFVNQISDITEENKLPLLCNYISADVFQYVNDSSSFQDAIELLDSLYVTKRNEIYARHCLASRTQLAAESISEYLHTLKQMSKDCEFKSVSAEQYKCEYIRDAFIRGLKSARIRERLLENSTITLESAFDQARALEMAELHSASYLTPTNQTPVAAAELLESNDYADDTTAAIRVRKCFFCGNDRHTRNVCPAKDVLCRSCGKKGHYQRVCKSKPSRGYTNSIVFSPTLASIVPHCLQKSFAKIEINGVELNALVDTGSSLSFINQNFVNKCKIQVRPYFGRITLANSSLSSDIAGCCMVTVKLDSHLYQDVDVLVMKNLCADFLIGHDILKNHSSVEIDFCGGKPPLKICSLATAEIPPVSLFINLSPDCRPIVTKSRRLTEEDKLYIVQEIDKLLEEGIIEPSNSPWRAQAFVVRGDLHRPRMVIDYSQTINKFTLLDAYPLPKIEEVIARISKYKVFSTIDLKSAYHQIPIKESEKHYTAFEAGGKLYHFLRVPFGVTNGVACFQRVIDKIIQDEGLEGTFPYIDNITVCGDDQVEHDTNLKKLLASVKKYNLTLNEEKCQYSSKTVKLLGYIIENKTIKPDPDRLAPLMNLPVPNDSASLQRALGMFSHYCRWIPSFSKKIQPLLVKNVFPLSEMAVKVFESLKTDVANASLTAIEDDIPFRVETDASDFAIGATLSQANRPIAFFSRTLNKSELGHSSIEKEAYAIVESLRHWRHFLIGRNFEVLTDQRSVSFMFNQCHNSKIKNEKIMRWRLDLACYKFDIIYRPGKKNTIADTFSRISAAVGSVASLDRLHEALCHPGVTRMYHWVRSKNLPFSLEDIKRITNSCLVCSELKPRFCKNEGRLIKATSPFEKLSLDFKGPLPSKSKNRFILTILDEYSRFPFAIPCPDVSAVSVINSLRNIFSIFGMPAYIHSDRGSSFMSYELKSFLTSQGIATSRTTAYNPLGNGQVERYNGIIWRTVQLALKSRKLAVERWEEVLPDALHSIRSLLCTSTNATPHERMFTHVRRSHSGQSLPTWLSQPGTVLMKNNARTNKYEPLVQEVELIEANPDYAYIRFPDGRETSVSVRHLAQRGESTTSLNNGSQNCNSGPVIENLQIANSKDSSPKCPDSNESSQSNTEKTAHESPKVDVLTRPTRLRQQPSYLKDYIMG